MSSVVLITILITAVLSGFTSPLFSTLHWEIMQIKENPIIIVATTLGKNEGPIPDGTCL